MRASAIVFGVTLLVLLGGPAIGEGPDVVTFKTADRLVITGNLFSTGRRGAPAVIALHAHDADRSSWQGVAESLLAAGIDVLAIDMRGYGASAKQRGRDLTEKSRARDKTHFRSMWKDVAAAYEFLIERGVDPGRIAFLGAGVGCNVAIDAASRVPSVLCGVLLEPEWEPPGLDTRKHLKGYGPRPTLVTPSAPDAIKQTVGDGLSVLDGEDGFEGRAAQWLTTRLGAGVYLDGEVTPEDGVMEELGEYNMMENGRGTPVIRILDGFLYVGYRMEAGTPPPERFLFAWARDADPARARRLECLFDAKRGATFNLQALKDGRWSTLKKALPKNARLGISSELAVEVLIPRTLEGLDGDGSVHVAFGLALRASNHVSALPVGDNELTKVAEWMEYALTD